MREVPDAKGDGVEIDAAVWDGVDGLGLVHTLYLLGDLFRPVLAFMARLQFSAANFSTLI